MANWIKSFFEQNTDKATWPVFKRAKHSLHLVRPDGKIEANFTGVPCHYEELPGIWKPLDTVPILEADGFYGAPGLDVLIHLDGRVRVKNSDYEQVVELPGNPKGVVEGDAIVRAFAGGKQYLRITETGFREVIVIDKKTFPFEKFIVKKTGTLPAQFTEGVMLAKDANGAEFVYTEDLAAFGNWLDSAVYPVTIDPDFVSGASYGRVSGYDGTYATARSTSAIISNTDLYIGQNFGSSIYQIFRIYLKFDTNTIPDTAMITQVNMKLVCISDQSTTDFDVQIVKQDWSAQDPLAAGNREAAYDNCLAGTADDNIWRNTNGMSINTQYASGNLTTAWVNKIGNTYYSLRSIEDYNNSYPIDNEYIALGEPDNATPAYRPILTVVYSVETFIPRIIMI